MKLVRRAVVQNTFTSTTEGVQFKIRYNQKHLHELEVNAEMVMHRLRNK